MARRLSWSDVRGGAIASAAILLLAFVTLKYSSIGALHGSTFRMYALVGEARGVLVGSEVWLSDQKVGKVTGIRFNSPNEPPDARIEISMEVLDAYRVALHKDAVAQIQSGGSLIGAPVVYLTPGTVNTTEIANGDTVKSAPQSDAENAAGEFGRATKEFPAIMGNVKIITAQLKATQGTLGALLNVPEETRQQVAQTGASVSRTMQQISANPSLSTTTRGELIERVRTAMARSDSLRTLVASPRTSLGRFRRDSTLATDVADVRNELSIVRAQVDQRLHGDTALIAAVKGAEEQMTVLVTDVKKHPLRYIRF